MTERQVWRQKDIKDIFEHIFEDRKTKKDRYKDI